jgi:Fe-S cluster assembly protein SufD
MSTWLEERRAEAREVYERTPLPTLREENWRYTSLRGIDFEAFQPAAEAPGEAPAGLLGGLKTAGTLVQRGQAIVHRDLDAAPGVVLGSLEAAADEGNAVVSANLGAVVGLSDRFLAENAARWSGGALVHVPAGVEVAAPLRVAVEIPSPGARLVWRMLVVAEAGARVSIVEEHLPGAEGYLNGVVELVLGDGAQVDLVQVQDLHPGSLHFTTTRAEIGRDATLRWSSLEAGGRLGKARMESRLSGPGASVRVTGLYALNDRQHLDLDTSQEHAAPHTTSDLAFKGALLDRSRAVWRGIIKVDEGAQRTDAFQENRNLLLSKRAHADSIPGLEILANDVRCTHAATVSQVDRELLFFLMARGFSRPEAERIIVAGFFTDALERVPSEDVRSAFSQSLGDRIA